MSTKPDKSRIALTIDLDAPGRQVGDAMLRWSDNDNPLGYHPIPIISLRGRPGPTLLVIGGTHGDEFEGPAAILRLAAQLNPDELAGQVILIPGLNAPALRASARVSPLDGGNLNRAFPGDANGGPTAMIAHFVETVLMPRCDAVIDLHSGGKASFFEPCALPTQCADPELAARNNALARAFGLPLIWALGELNDNRSVNAAAERAGVAMIAAELGGGGNVTPHIAQLARDGVMNCLAHLGILDRAVPAAPKARWIQLASPLHSLFAPADGLFDRTIAAGRTVRKGEDAGWFHFPQEPARASIALTMPADGFVLAHCMRGMVRRGELLALVAQTTE